MHKQAIALNDIYTRTIQDEKILVAKQGQQVDVLQSFDNISFIQVDGYGLEVVVNNDEIEII